MIQLHYNTIVWCGSVTCEAVCFLLSLYYNHLMSRLTIPFNDTTDHWLCLF